MSENDANVYYQLKGERTFLLKKLMNSEQTFNAYTYDHKY